jgi:hypothetical protein
MHGDCLKLVDNMVTACCRDICSSGVLRLAGDQEVKEAAVREGGDWGGCSLGRRTCSQ